MMASVNQSRIERNKARKFLQQKLRAEMTTLGFCFKNFYVKKLNDETTLLVSLQILEGETPLLGLFPRVGFMNWKVEQFIDGLFDPIKPTPKFRYTLSTTLGCLLPEDAQNECYFEGTEAAIRDSVQAVVGNVSKYGIPFMTRYPDLVSLLAWAKNPMIEPHAVCLQPWLWRAAILYVGGDPISAREIIAREIAYAGDDDLNDPNFVPTLRLGTRLGVARRDRH
jgi:hypothetical protein